MKYVSALSPKQVQVLQSLQHDDTSAQVRMRAHSILLSNRKYTINQIADIYEVYRDTVSGWLAAWEQEGPPGLRDQPRSGRPSQLTAAEQERAIELLKETPRAIKTALAKLSQETGKQLSVWTLKRLAQQKKMKWKRIRKSLKAKRDATAFKRAQEEIKVLQAQHAAGEIELRYFDEVGFTLTPCVPYAWQLSGERVHYGLVGWERQQPSSQDKIAELLPLTGRPAAASQQHALRVRFQPELASTFQA